jgi:GMP synthase (glutamine-hydrolysing)
MKVHFIIHEAYEGPGALLTWAEDRNYVATSSKIYLGESLPLDSNALDLLIILGGPQCPETTVQECHYFRAEKEVSFIHGCIESGKAVVGVCLGAQLIGEALGAKFEKSPNKEIGYFPIDLTDYGVQHPKFTHFSSKEVVGHWHNDMPGLTLTSKVLATSAGCPRQIVEYSNLVYGLQCHLEFTPETINELIKNSYAEFDNYNYVQNIEYIIASSSLHMNSLLFEFMDKLAHEYTSSIDL